MFDNKKLIKIKTDILNLAIIVYLSQNFENK